MSKIIIDMYHPFRYGNETPESRIQTAVSPTARIGSSVLRWSGISALPDTVMTIHSAPIEALALEFSATSFYDPQSAPSRLPTTEIFKTQRSE